MVFCNKIDDSETDIYYPVTILILIDGFLQLKYRKKLKHQWKSHNPYFNRWFSAIENKNIKYKMSK